ncbi:hypothetical protein FRC01_001278 [Tulasnella sp. 417]|nr:hypothetical protein FRC01_001278 [Tulasnella sp. 417]
MENSTHKLPTELLVEILLEAVGGPAGWTFQKVHTLAKVCRRWNDIILRTPRLWCTIQSGISPTYNNLVLKRNQWGPLMVRSNFESWLKDIAARSRPNRWNALEFGDCHYSAASQDIVNSATNLQHLTIALSRVAIDQPAALPNPTELHTLHLRFVRILWTGLDSLRLESLWLENLPLFPTNNQIFSVLRSSPCLRCLVLREFHVNDQPADAESQEQPLPEAQQRDPIDLPCLEILVISLVPSSLCHSLLWRLHIPSCKTAYLDDCHSTHFEAASESKLPETLSRIFVAAKEIRLTFKARVGGNYPVVIETLDPRAFHPSMAFGVPECSGLTLRALLPELYAWNNLADAVGLKDFTGTTTLSVGDPRSGMIGSSAHPMGTPFFQRIAEDMGQSIGILELSLNPLPILQYLAVPQRVAGTVSVERWPCPNLRRISISMDGFFFRANDEELLHRCITVLQRSAAKTESLAAPRQLDEFFWYPSSGIIEILSMMDEFRNVKFLGFREGDWSHPAGGMDSFL